jgi:hypothetical protein
LRYPRWQREYLDALFEVDPKKPAERVAEAGAAIFKRLQALSQSQDRHTEREAIRDAIRALGVIKRDSLSFPDWKSGLRGS